MFARLGRFAADHARLVLVVAGVLLAGAAVLGMTAFGKLQSQGFDDPGSDSSRATALAEQHFGGEDNLLFLVQARDGTVDDPATRAAGAALTERLAADPALESVTSYWATGAPPLRADDSRSALIVTQPADTSADAVKAIVDRYQGEDGLVTVTAGGGAVVGLDINDQVSRDLLVAEMIAVPIILVLLFLVFGGVIAALLPLVVGGIAVLGTFAELSVFGSLTDVSVFAINLTTALGLGLGIDYALLMVSRFREELATGADTHTAVIRTVASAGRTISFSAATVAVALAALLLFPQYFLRSYAYAGIGVIVIAMLAAVVVLPALLTVLGPRVNAARLPWARGRTPSTVSAFWGRVAAFAMKRPALAVVPVLVVLVAAATPLLGVQFGTPDERVLPDTASSRVVGDELRAHYPANDSRAIEVVALGTPDAATIAGYAGRLSELDGAAHVSSSAGGFSQGRADGPANPALGTPTAQKLSVVTAADSRSAEAETVVAEVRALPAPPGLDVAVGGDAAALVDSKDAIGSRLPVAAGLIAVTTFILLFLFTGSVLQPLRALLFNLLSLSATMGMMVLVFQQGFAAGFLGFTPLPLDTSMLMLLFCIAFGLSMDYEVFVVSRIKEAHDHGLGPREAVVHGLSRTGRIVSAAALLLAVSVFAFGTSGVSFIQMFGIGTGLAILIDATLVRGVLLPAGMRLLGRYAWWAPEPLRRLHERIGVSESAKQPAAAR
ncbi:MMPL family transporter [Amycolatopsis methanolica]|uniref:Integral membrane protein n=1 Tax=Amycolatopsis methanolica 239 TaxID=1068978 RepID=A0A076MY73_AMYME|nr:MMPL family transporter [Amycolatopsis methanolica]AIJ23625.1 integral membrane protein [Amycolatopsis methanolica 239]